MAAAEIDRSDPAVRAGLALRDTERGQRTRRHLAGIVLAALAVAGPFVAAPLAGGPSATVGAVVASVLWAGCAVLVWPWPWSPAEREHHRLAGVWAEARPGAAEPVAWDRHAAWAQEREGAVDLMLVTRSGTATRSIAASPFSAVVVETFDPDAVVDATAAMEHLREDAAEREARAHERHLEAVAAAARKPYDDALRRVDEDAAAAEQRAETEMRHELARQEAAERRAQAAAVARALRRP